jgi:hypothetical protein
MASVAVSLASRLSPYRLQLFHCALTGITALNPTGRTRCSKSGGLEKAFVDELKLPVPLARLGYASVAAEMLVVVCL